MPKKQTTSTQIDSDLAALAAAYGVAVEYTDQVGILTKVAPDSVRAVLASLGVQAKTPQQCRRSLADLKAAHWASTVPPVIVVRRTSGPDQEPWETWVHVRKDDPVRVWIELEEGGRRFDVSRTDRRVKPAQIKGARVDEVVFRLPSDLPLGWHEFVAEVAGTEERCSLVVCPERLEKPDNTGKRQEWGVATQLYSARSHRSWGIGDLADLSDMAAWFGREHGAAFMLVNPLHACAPAAGMEPSPYLPVTRRYVNPLYLRVELIPEYAYLAPERLAEVSRAAEVLTAELNTDKQLDRDQSWKHKRDALLAIHKVELSPGRAAEYRAYRAAEGDALVQFATWCALAEHYGPQWDDWPKQFHDQSSPAVDEFRSENADAVDFHCWLQWVLDQQMAQAQQAAIDAGMPVGIMHDLAVGVHSFGADTWTDGAVMASGVTVGAPPDAFNQVGQDWSQPPMRPDQLAATGYASYRDMLRTLLRHSGGLRIDHVLGLFRLWWIPQGLPPSAGTYVRYDHHAMVNILVLEAHRAGAVIVGEDLGTVEPWVSDFLAERGVLGTTILWFERADGEPIPPQQWRANAMAAVTVHDLPPTLGYLAGDHVALREELGLLTRSVDVEWAEHANEIASWRAALERDGLLRPGAGEDGVVTALHRYVTWSPARLVSVSLADLVGERRTQNQPGTKDEYPNWRVPLADSEGEPVFIEDFPKIARMEQIINALGGSAKSS